MERSSRAPWTVRVLTVALVAIAACFAAVVSHFGIDALGDVLLARDAYDTIAHGSRAMTAGVAGSLLLACVACSMWMTVLDVRAGRPHARAALDAIANRAPRRFVAAVTVATPLALLAMEALDTLAQSGRIDDIGDLFGGSIALALGVAIPTAVAVAVLVRSAIGGALRSLRAIAVAVDSFLRRVFGDASLARLSFGSRWMAPVGKRPCVASLNAGRRGPPHLSARTFRSAA